MSRAVELAACTPIPVEKGRFNSRAVIPFGLTTDHLFKAMKDFTDFLGFINAQLHTKEIIRMENILMPANFSSMVGEFVITAIPKHCPTLVRNDYHNGHPDLLPKDLYLGNSKQYGEKGIEIKGSRYSQGWQGHNPEACWLMVFVFDSNRPKDDAAGEAPRPFQFKSIFGAELTKDDWKFAGRSEESRRTITAAITAAGARKMKDNWIYQS